jgi:hypothetical protein
MDIKEILDTLGLDLNDPETKKGAIEAIDAILTSRASASSNAAGIGTAGGKVGGEEVEIDPDLLMPSQKQSTQGSGNDDVEIEDEEDILSQVEFNQSEDENEQTSKEPSPDEQDSQESSDDTESSDNTNDGSEETNTDTSEDEIQPSDNGNEANPDSDFDGEIDPEESEEYFNDEEDIEDSDSDANEFESSEDENEDEDEEAKDIEDDEDFDFDEEDFLDNDEKDTYEDEESKTKHNARKIKRERAIAAAKTALEKAKNKQASASLIKNLEKAIEDLEALTEAVSKSLKDISDDEFNTLINNVFDAIEALGDSELTYKSDEERAIQAQEIKDDLADTGTQQELSAEDAEHIRAEHQAAKAREKEANKYKQRSANSFKGFQDFLNSLYRAVALQVSTEETNDDSWSAINRRHSGTGVLQPGKKIQELSNKKIPIIDFYFDQSGSWTEADIAFGEQAVAQLAEMEEKGDIKINIYYFANNVYSDAASARREGGTRAWNEIVKNVIATQATNVIIMTDSDMEDWWRGDKALSYTVPGYVWYLWRNGDNAPSLPRYLKGRGGTQQFSFSRY